MPSHKTPSLLIGNWLKSALKTQTPSSPNPNLAEATDPPTVVAWPLLPCKWPVAGEYSQLLQPQRQGLPTCLWSVQQVPLPMQSHFQVSPFPFPKPTRTHHPIWTPSRFYTDDGLPFASEDFEQFLLHQCMDHITSSSHFPWCNGFIEWQGKMLKTTLSTSQDTRMPGEDLLSQSQLVQRCPHQGSSTQ